MSSTLEQLLALADGGNNDNSSNSTKNANDDLPVCEQAAVEMAETLSGARSDGTSVASNDSATNPAMEMDCIPPIEAPTTNVKIEPEPIQINAFEQPISIQVSPRECNGIERIYKDANFSSFADFESAFEEWKQQFHHPFRVASSEKHEDKELAERFKYRYVVYHCSRYGEPRKRGAGRRPHQNYLPCGCNAKLRLNFHGQNEGSLCVTTLVTEHNHPPISEDSSFFGVGGSTQKRRKSSPEEWDVTGHSPNSSASSMAATVPFSPLSLQPGLHHSPSSGGQSSSEGAHHNNGGIGLHLGALLGSPMHAQKADLKTNGQRQHSTPSAAQSAAVAALISPNMVNKNGGIAAFLAKVQRQEVQGVQPTGSSHNSAQQPTTITSMLQQNFSELFQPNRQPHQQQSAIEQQQALLPLIQQLLHSANQQQQLGESSRTSANQHLLGLLSPHQQVQKAQPGGNGNSSIFSALQQKMQEQSTFSSTPAHSSAATNMLAMLQLQMLVNSTAAKQQQSQAAHQSTSNNNANAKLLQMLAGTGGGVNNGNGSQMPRAYGNNGGDQNQQRASTSTTTMARSFNGGNNIGGGDTSANAGRPNDRFPGPSSLFTPTSPLSGRESNNLTNG